MTPLFLCLLRWNVGRLIYPGPKLSSTVAQKGVKVGAYQQKGVLSDRLLAGPFGAADDASAIG